METTTIILQNSEITSTYSYVANKKLGNFTIANEQVSGCKIENVVFEKVIFEGVDFQSTHFKETKFIDCVFVNCNFGFSKFENCNLIASKMENCNFCITNSLNSNFLSCTYEKNTWDHSTIEGQMIDCNIDEFERSKMDFTAIEEFTTLSSLPEAKAAQLPLWMNPWAKDYGLY